MANSYKVGVNTYSDPEGVWTYNALRFATRVQAEKFGCDLFSRWMAVRKFEVHESDDEPTEGVDVKVQNHGTIFLFDLLTERSREWVDEHVTGEMSWMGDSTLAVEHRYARDLAEGMKSDGLEIR